MNWWHVFFTVMKKEWLLSFRQKSDLINPLAFFLLVLTLFPIAVGPFPKLLQQIGPGVIWVAAVLANLLAAERMFKQSFHDGSLEQQALSSVPFSLTLIAKVVANWFVLLVPLILISPVTLMFFHLNFEIWFVTILTLIIGGLTIFLFSSVGAALTVSLHRGSVLMALLVIPLYIPVLIFATGAINAASLGFAYHGQLAILGAMMIVSLLAAPFAMSTAIRVGLG